MQPAMSGTKVRASEIGLEGWCVAGWRDYGAVYGKALAFARQEMRKALERGLDPVTHEPKPQADPVAALDRLVYDLLVIAVEGLPTVAEMPPIPETVRTAKRKPTRRDLLVDALHDFLRANDSARLTVDGVAWTTDGGGVYAYSSAVVQQTVTRIEGLLAEKEVAA